LKFQYIFAYLFHVFTAHNESDQSSSDALSEDEGSAGGYESGSESEEDEAGEEGPQEKEGEQANEEVAFSGNIKA
jgi:hypothetical protein